MFSVCSHTLYNTQNNQYFTFFFVFFFVGNKSKLEFVVLGDDFILFIYLLNFFFARHECEHKCMMNKRD